MALSRFLHFVQGFLEVLPLFCKVHRAHAEIASYLLCLSTLGINSGWCCPLSVHSELAILH